MESIVEVVRGDNLDISSEDCVFCFKQAVGFISTIAGKKHDGLHIISIPTCKEHFDKINSLLSGKFDIDDINLEQYKTHKPGSGIRMRRI